MCSVRRFLLYFPNSHVSLTYHSARQQPQLTLARCAWCSVETLSALGRLERLTGFEQEAERHLMAAVRRDPRMPSALSELATLREAQVRTASRWEGGWQHIERMGMHGGGALEGGLTSAVALWAAPRVGLWAARVCAQRGG